MHSSGSSAPSAGTRIVWDRRPRRGRVSTPAADALTRGADGPAVSSRRGGLVLSHYSPNCADCQGGGLVRGAGSRTRSSPTSTSSVSELVQPFVSPTWRPPASRDLPDRPPRARPVPRLRRDRPRQQRRLLTYLEAGAGVAITSGGLDAVDPRPLRDRLPRRSRAGEEVEVRAADAVGTKSFDLGYELKVGRPPGRRGEDRARRLRL